MLYSRIDSFKVKTVKEKERMDKEMKGREIDKRKSKEGWVNG